MPGSEKGASRERGLPPLRDFFRKHRSGNGEKPVPFLSLSCLILPEAGAATFFPGAGRLGKGSAGRSGGRTSTFAGEEKQIFGAPDRAGRDGPRAGQACLRLAAKRSAGRAKDAPRGRNASEGCGKTAGTGRDQKLFFILFY